MIHSRYDDPAQVAAAVTSGRHRDFIGGMWEKIGQHQFDLLIREGLKPQHRFLDVGCGVFRAGVLLIPYLEPSHYYGIDIDEKLLRAGYEREIEPLGLAPRFPWLNLAINRDFEASSFDVSFDYGIAQSVFTHMPISELTRCLKAITPFFRPGGLFFVTYFNVPEESKSAPCWQPHGVLTYPDRDPYHQSVTEIEAAAASVPEWRLEVIGNWNHPREQYLLRFERVTCTLS